MARRKTGFLSDGESSGDSNADSDELDDGHHKRQRRGGKEDALYGVFAEDDDSGLGTRRERVNRVDFTRGPAFTTGSSSSTLATPAMDNLSGHQPVPIEASSSADGAQTTGFDEAEEDGADDDSGDDDSDSSDSDARPAPARVRDDEESEDEMPSMASFKGKGRAAGGGLGFTASAAALETSTAANTPPPTNAPKASFFAPPSSSYAPGPSASDNVPTSFASAPKAARSFLLPSQKAPKPAPSSTADLSKDDVQALNKLQGSFGARMLGKMGWSAGSGLGQDGAGIVAPIDVKLRPSKMGLGGKGFKERTDQSIREAIRNGDLPAQEKKEVKSKGGKKKDGKDLGAAIESEARGEEWKRKKKIKTKVTHLTYEEILEQSGGVGVGASSGVGVIIDATGATPREISSLSQSAQPWSSASMPTARLPELRHNLRTITSQTVMALEALAKEGVSVREKRHRLAMEEESLRRRIEAEALQIARLQTLHTLINEIKEVSKTETALRPATSAASAAGINSQPRLEAFDAIIDRLVFEFGPEFDVLGLDEVVVGAIAPAVKRLLVEWKPLEEDGILPHLRKWRKAFRLAASVEDEGVVDVYDQTRARERKEVDREMTPFESLVWNLWLPKVRSAINNDWTPVNPSPAIYLYTAWSSLLPQFVKDNILDQLILPKLSKAVNEWKPRRDGSGPTLGSLIFPWLQVLQSGEGGEGRGQEILEDGKRRMRGVVKGWRIGEDIPGELLDWKKVFARNEWDSLLLKYVLPKLGAHIRSNFTVNPRAQSLEPLQEVFKWNGVLRSRMLSHLMEDEFVGKWLDVLYIWLVSPKPSFDEVTQWYSYWKTVFPEDVFVLKGVQSGFRRGLDLMNQAMSLGPEAVSQLPRPSLTAPLSPSPRSSAKRSTNGTTDASGRHSRRPDRKDEDEVTFRELAEAFVVERDLIWASTGRSDLNTGQPLFRISKDGRTGGCVGYVSADAFYVLEGPALDGVGKPIGLEEVVKRAEGKTVS